MRQYALLRSELLTQPPGNQDQAKASGRPGPGGSPGLAGGGREPSFCVSCPPPFPLPCQCYLSSLSSARIF